MRDPEPVSRKIKVWDLPTRLFHWSLVGLVALSLYTGNVGGLREMDLHMLSGYTILTLVLFRILWGFVGGAHARFSDFVKGPGAVLAYLRGEGGPYLGHNPLGAGSVLALLAVLLVQAATGLCANDDIFLEGPLAPLVGKAMSDTLTFVHHLSAKVLYALVALHLGAIAFYRLVKKEDLVRPMVTGRKPVPDLGTAEDAREAPLWAAPVVLAIAAGAVWALLAVA